MRTFVLAFATVGLLVAACAAADDWRSIACIPADPFPEEMFDVTHAVDGFETEPLRWEALHDGQNAKATLEQDTAEHYAGSAAMRVDYHFTGRKDLEYVQINTNLDLREPGLAFGFWVKTDGTPFHFRLRVADRSGETHQFDMLSAHCAGWQFTAVPLSNPSTAWGGDGNHRLDYPCRLAGICIDRPKVGFSARVALDRRRGPFVCAHGGVRRVNGRSPAKAVRQRVSRGPAGFTSRLRARSFHPLELPRLLGHIACPGPGRAGRDRDQLHARADGLLRGHNRIVRIAGSALAKASLRHCGPAGQDARAIGFPRHVHALRPAQLSAGVHGVAPQLRDGSIPR